MIGSILAAVAALVGQNPENPKPKVDRSGEAAFRALLQEIAAKKKYHGLILRSNREAGSKEFYPDGIIEVWRDGEKFRVDFGDMWGSSTIVVSDGKRVLEDLGQDPVTFKKPASNWPDTSSALVSQGSAGSPWHYLVEGPGLLDRLDKDRAITAGTKPNSIVWDSTLFGKLTITKERDDKEMEVWEIEYDNMPQQAEMFKLYPEWFEAPDANARWRQRVILTEARIPKGTFDTKPSRGRQVTDLTKEGKGN